MTDLVNIHATSSYLKLSILVVMIAGFLFGFDTGNISGALFYINSSFSASGLVVEVIVASTILGAFFGALISGKSAAVYGRKYMLILSGLAYVLGTLIAAFSCNAILLILGRTIIGFAIGVSSCVAPMYIAELAPTKLRGQLVVLNGVAITGGEVIAFLSDYYFSDGGLWRQMILVGVFPALLFFVGMFFLPESPRWLINKNRYEEANKWLDKLGQSIFYLRRPDHNSISSSFDISLCQLIRSKEWRKPMFIGIGLGVLQQMFGINVIMYYGPIIFKAAGLGDRLDIFATFLLGLVNLIMTIITSLYVDKVGRRKLLMLGSLIALISLLAVSMFFYLHESAVLILLGMICFIMGYCMSVGSLFWVIISEIFPAKIREKAIALATAVQWLANFLVSVTFLTLIEGLSSDITFLIYAGFCFLGILFSYYFVPETKGMSFGELDDLWHKKTGVIFNR